MSRAKAWFLGGGPGAPDLLTLRATRAIAEADIVIWGSRHVMEGVVTEHAQPSAELIPWPPATMEDLLGAYERAAENDLVVARLIGGDPAVYVSMSEEIERARELELPYEVVPGVGALSAAAAALGGELVTARTDETLLIVSPKAEIERLADPAVTIAVYMAGRSEVDLQQRLLAGGYPPETPCAVFSRLTWPDEAALECRLDQLADRLDELGAELGDENFGRQTLLLAGPTVGRGSHPPACRDL
ncbi:MAG: SAM-dependent methyltransferase [Solirubrobacterales bacterium]